MCVYLRINIILLVTGALLSCDKLETAQTRIDFPEVMLELQNNIEAKGYQVSRVQQVDVGMKKAGYTIEEYRVVFFAKPGELKTILEYYPEFASFLPLSITIYREGELTKLVGMPFALPRAYASSEKLEAMISVWEKDTSDIIHETVQPSY